MTKTRSRLLPLTYSPQLLPLVLSGAKTETMRVTKPQPQPIYFTPPEKGVMGWRWENPVLKRDVLYSNTPELSAHDLRKDIADAYKLQPGDQFYCNEQIEILDVGRGIVLLRYTLDQTERECTLPERVKTPEAGLWRGRNIPPEWARPFRGTVQTVVGKRVQETSAWNCLQEGINQEIVTAAGIGRPDWSNNESLLLDAMRYLWDTINTDPAHRWDADPWVSSIAWTPGTAE